MKKTDLNKVDNGRVTLVFQKSLISENFLKIPKSRPNFEIETQFSVWKSNFYVLCLFATMGLWTLRTRFLKGGTEGPPRVIPVLPEPGADRVKSNDVIQILRMMLKLTEFYILLHYLSRLEKNSIRGMWHRMTSSYIMWHIMKYNQHWAFSKFDLFQQSAALTFFDHLYHVIREGIKKI